MENRNNIFERKMKQAVPKTRDRFVSNPFVQLVAPERKQKVEGYIHDKLDISDIKGTKVDTYQAGKYKNIEGRNYMDLGDIYGTKPNQLK
jgi:hypothetical protein